MEPLSGPAGGGAPDAKPQPGPHPRQHRPRRAPSPARPFPKDPRARPAAAAPPARAPGPRPPAPPARRSGAGARDRPPPGAGARAAAGARRAARPGAREPPRALQPAPAKAPRGPAPPARAPARAAPRPADSGSDLSDCPSEPLSDEPRRGPAARAEAGGRPPPQRAAPGEQPRPAPRAAEQELLREMEELRSENDYLKDELDELRAEMEEMRDSYLEEDVYQLQELRRELDRANKNCRILQYRLRKAEQKSLKAAETGQVDGELVRSLEQDLKVAKDVSVRLHHELETVEEKRAKAEDENETLRQQVIEVEVSRQALQNELERLKESSLKRRGSREMYKEKKTFHQDDSADLKCQLQFAKEEASLMRKKMARLGREKDALEHELQKYRALYGDVDSPLPPGEAGGPPSSREAELKLRLKLVEEEASILGRKIVELEVENRGLKAELEDVRAQPERERAPGLPTSPFGDALESPAELRRRLQFVEEEAELLRRSASEAEDLNRQLARELSRVQLEPRPPGPLGDGWGQGQGQGQGQGAGPPPQEEPRAAQLKLQHENCVLLSSVQRCDLAAHLGPRAPSPRDSDADSAEGRLPRPKREGPVGGESDSEDLFETTSGLGSSRPSEASEPCPSEPRAREDSEGLAAVRQEAQRLERTVERLICDTDGILDAAAASPGAQREAEGGPAGQSQPPLPGAVLGKMKAFRRELQAFLEQLARVGDGLSPLPHLSESSSFLSSVTSVSRDSPVGNSGKELAAELQSQVRGQPEWQPGQDGGDERECPHLRTAREPQRRADGHAGSHRAGGRSRLDLELGQEHLCAVRWKELEAHSLALQGTLQERAWSDERAPLRQELRALKHSVFLFYAKLRWLLKHWRQGTQMEEGAEELAEMEHPGAFPGLAELGVQGGYQVDGTDQCNGDRGDHSPHSPVQIGDHGSRPQCVDGGPPPRQVENQQLLGALGALLEDLRSELREDELARLRLQQQHASDKAAWDVEWAVLKGRLAQLEEKTEKGLGELESCAESRGALRKEREVHQRLLADSHGLVMDLRWQIHRSQRNWDREKVELLERLDRGRRAWEQQRKELLWTIEQLQNENGPQRGKSFLCDQKEGNKRPSPHQGGLRERPLAMWPCGDTDSIPFEDRPLSKLKESDRCSASENLYLDALSLDEEPEETPPRGPERESRKCLPEEEENPRGNLQRAVSVSSMSEFQRLMDVSPFLPEKGPPPASSREDVTPPLSPDDLKYIEEFNGKGWDCTPPRARARTEAPAEPFPDSSWYLTTSVTMTTDTMTSPEHCQKQPPRSHVLAEPSCVRVLHSPPTVRRADSIVPPAGEDPLPASRGRGAPGDARGAHTEPVLGRWACAPSRHPRDCVEGALCSSPLLGLDPKEAAFCVRSAASPGPPRPQVKDMACQTSGSRTTGVQTVPSISVGLQTEALRGGLTSSPHKCLTPKAAGGATPVSSPSRGLRSRQVAPAIAIEKEKAQAKFERTCCSPKYGSPKLQRKPPKAEQPSRASPGAAQKGCSASAWARSTTTRESPVHTTIGDGLSSLFSVIDHGPAVQDAFQKGARPGSHSRPAELRPELGPGQEAASRGRSPSPLGVGAETGREEGGDCTPVRQDLSAPPGYTLAESVARILNKKLLEHALEEQRRQASLGVPGLASDGHAGEMVTAEPGSMEELPCSAPAPSLEPCFSRPERPANRRPPSRWAPPSPTAAQAPSPGDPSPLEERGEEDAPEEKPHA